MTTLSFQERRRITKLWIDRARRSALSQLLHSPLLRWKYGGPTADELLLIPQELRTADPSFASEIEHGFFGLDGFSYTIRDAAGATASANVSVTVNEVVDGGGGPPAVQNFVANGDAEAGLDGWRGIWDATASLATPGLDGSNSVRASGGYAVIGDLVTPVPGGRRLAFSATLSSNASNIVYAYLRVLQNGSWRYQFVTGAGLASGRTSQLQRSFSLPAGDVEAGYIMFYFPRRLAGDVLIDQVQLTAE